MIFQKTMKKGDSEFELLLKADL